ncbi:Mitochondrial SSU ribosomal protein [Trypanosoma brucei equiperdum]|nr:Mitochondrial SSU ribosomal protein [Trypanosoma brucei equiperdum]
MRHLADVVQEIAGNPHVTWAADMHLQVVETMVGCGTMKANDYFVRNVLRQFSWDSRFLEALYVEYRRQDDVDMWAELTKRALVWTARYNAPASERLRRLIEDDYDTIRVQTRTFRELAVFQFRDVEERRHSRDVVNELPNPWYDYVAHALPFPDRDAGYPDEYGDLGQWRAPGGPGSPVRGPGYYAPPMEGEHQRGYTAEWRDLRNPMRPPEFPTPWERKYRQYARGQHPSYDMVYAGPMPEIFPMRRDFRKPTRWDFHDIEKQGKYRTSGPY